MSESDSRTRSGAPSVEAAAAGTAASGEPGPDGAVLGNASLRDSRLGNAPPGGPPPGDGALDDARPEDADLDLEDADLEDADLDDAGRGGRGGARRSRLWWAPLVLVVVAGLLAAGAALGDLLDRPPGEGSVDVGFARDMSEHHAQAVQMAMVEFDHGADQDTRNVAQDVALTQQREIGVMSAWLSGWGRAQTGTGPPMVWMHDDPAVGGAADGSGHDMAGMDMSGSSGSSGSSTDSADTARMPGMATPAELQRLASSRGHDLDVLFLTLMVRHHRGGVEMAQYAALHAGDDKVRTAARATVVSQSAEIDQMQRDLVRLGASRA